MPHGRTSRARCERPCLYGTGGAARGDGGAKKGKRSASAAPAQVSWDGVLVSVQRRYEETDSDALRMELAEFMVVRPCAACGGRRLKPESLAVTIQDKNLGELVEWSVVDALAFFDKLPVRANGKPGLDPDIAGPILKEVRERLRFLVDVGLDYLTLGRSAESLSGGEAQRIRLATQIGSRLVGVLYILDEPSIGLHQRDNARLLKTLEHLRDLGNTVIVVEHDEETIRAADHIVDLGPGAGKHGGHVIAQGTIDDILGESRSLTGQYLSGAKEIPIPPARRATDPSRVLRVHGAREHNLADLTVDFPLGAFVAVTGVSGSGKSTLVEDILHRSLARHFYRARVIPGEHQRITGLEHIDKVIDIDQSPIGRTPRSNPATYTGLFTPIRELFAEHPEAKIRGYGPGRFSFNVKGGRCEACEGDGLVKIEMHFLPDVYVPCEVCKGKRYNRETLEVRFRGLNIADVLELTVEDALTFFENQPRIRQKLETLSDVGLGYIHLGQSATTLSGGEAQRVKLASELSKRDTGRTLYILDEPTTGLHFEDVRLLLSVLHRLVDRGNTVLVIEHNLDVIKTADWIVDLGPEGGSRGGQVIARGTPEQVAAAVRGSHTGAYLAPLVRGVATNRSLTAREDTWSPFSTSSVPSWWAPRRPIRQGRADSPARALVGGTPHEARSSCMDRSRALGKGTGPTRRSSAGCWDFGRTTCAFATRWASPAGWPALPVR
ncbi:MAG: excinuclease ABC subunit UvrA [Gemmatimonadaceae bacterium]